MRKILLAALPLAVSSLLAQGTPEGAEPNNGLVNLANIPVLALGSQAYGSLTAADEDWFAFTIGSVSNLRIFTGPGFASQAGDTRVRLYDSTGTLIIDQDDGFADSYYTLLLRTNQAAGNYFLGVKHFDTVAGTGSYTLDVVASPPPPAPPLTPVAEGPEVNDPRVGGGVATATVVFSRNAGSIGAIGAGTTSFTDPVADYDFYQFTVTTTGVHVLSTQASSTLTGTVCTDTVLYLVNSAMTVLASNDDFGGNGWSQVSFNITTPGNYYAVVRTYGSPTFGALGAYLCDVNGPFPAPPTGVATTTVLPGGCPGSAGIPTLGNRLSSTGINFFPERLVLGSTFVLDLTNLPASAPLFTFISTSAGPNFDLTPFGAPGCLLEIPFGTTGFTFGDPAGFYWWSIATPYNTAFIGLPIEEQVAVLDPLANAAGVSVSNRVSSVAGTTH